MASITKTRVVNESFVALPATSVPIPDRVVKLSFFDTYWIGLPPVQRILLYHRDNLPALPNILSSLKSSLALTLALYFPLAGKLTYLPSSRDVVIDCSANAVGPGVAFIEAEAIEGDIHKLAADEVHDLEAFLQLVPALDMRELPAPVFSVQLTKFGQDGLALRFSFSHVVADGKALWQFVESWATACRGEDGKLPEPAIVVQDRTAVIRHPKGDEIARIFLHQSAPILPKLQSETMTFKDRIKLVRRTFVISSRNIQLMKEKSMRSNKKITSSRLLTTFVTLSAHAWTTYVQSRRFDREDDVWFLMLADCRHRLNPPIDEGYFGNCVKAFPAKAKAGELLGEDGHSRACELIQRCMDENLEEPLKGLKSMVDLENSDFNFSKACVVSSSPRFKVYDVPDFGFGRPQRVELVSMNHNGEHTLSSAREGAGSVQISVALDPVCLEAFSKHFVDDFID